MNMNIVYTWVYVYFKIWQIDRRTHTQNPCVCNKLPGCAPQSLTCRPSWHSACVQTWIFSCLHPNVRTNACGVSCSDGPAHSCSNWQWCWQPSRRNLLSCLTLPDFGKTTFLFSPFPPALSRSLRLLLRHVHKHFSAAHLSLCTSAVFTVSSGKSC